MPVTTAPLKPKKTVRKAPAKPKVKPKLERPSMYRILIIDDDRTPMHFVVDVLKIVFNKSHEEAHEIMMLVHTRGTGLAGVFTLEVAEAKLAEVAKMMLLTGFIIRCDVEPDV